MGGVLGVLVVIAVMVTIMVRGAIANGTTGGDLFETLKALSAYGMLVGAPMLIGLFLVLIFLLIKAMSDMVENSAKEAFMKKERKALLIAAEGERLAGLSHLERVMEARARRMLWVAPIMRVVISAVILAAIVFGARTGCSSLTSYGEKAADHSTFNGR